MSDLPSTLAPSGVVNHGDRVLLVGAGTAGEDMAHGLAGVGLVPRRIDPCAPNLEDQVRFTDSLVAVTGDDALFARVAGYRLGHGSPMLFLPHGPGSNIARSLGLPDSTTEILDSCFDWHAATLRPADIDTGDGSRPCFDAHGAGGVSLSDAGSPRALCDALATAAPVDRVIEVDGQSEEGRWLMVEVLLQMHAGPGLPLAPEAMPGDGLLHVLAIPESDRAEMIAWTRAPRGAPPGVALAGRSVRITDGRTTILNGQLSRKVVRVLAPVPHPRRI